MKVPTLSTDIIPTLYLPRDVAKILKCSEWWVKEQARRRRIPFCWIGGSYRFTLDHLDEITRIFERQATDTDSGVVSARLARRQTRRIAETPTGGAAKPVSLVARVPPRARRSANQGSEAA